MKVAGSSQKARKRVKRFLRRVLMNAGVRTSSDPEQVFWEAQYVDLSAAANRGYWGDDKAFLGDPKADLRYFPVNLCGWSQISRAPCPREEFPERALNLAGESFKLLDPEKNGGKGLGTGIVAVPAEQLSLCKAVPGIPVPADGRMYGILYGRKKMTD